MVRALTGGRSVDTAIQAVGVQTTFQLCEDLVAPGRIIANIGVHNRKVDLHLERCDPRTSRSPRGVTMPLLMKTVRSKNSIRRA
jgi:alcohol dehydrogenase